jgi:arsenate reductase (thioredoxin)
MHRIRILFLCTGNSARSQMAEGLARALGGKRVHVWSAGIEPKGVHPLAVRAMAERGIDIASQQSKDLSAVPADPDVLITLCDNAADRCPAFPGRVARVHWSLPDPAAVAGTEDQRLAAFRAARAEIESRLVLFLRERGSLAGSAGLG